jgi:hypothetical protein
MHQGAATREKSDYQPHDDRIKTAHTHQQPARIRPAPTRSRPAPTRGPRSSDRHPPAADPHLPAVRARPTGTHPQPTRTYPRSARVRPAPHRDTRPSDRHPPAADPHLPAVRARPTRTSPRHAPVRPAPSRSRPAPPAARARLTRTTRGPRSSDPHHPRPARTNHPPQVIEPYARWVPAGRGSLAATPAGARPRTSGGVAPGRRSLRAPAVPGDLPGRRGACRRTP